MNANDPFQPLWWLEKLLTRLGTQSQGVATLEAYYDGEQPLPVALSTKQYRKEFDQMLRRVRDNWMPLVIDAVGERLNVTGFRFGEDTSSDSAASELWQRCFLDADSSLAHATALTTGRCPIMVWAGQDGRPEITVEHPSQVVVAYEAGSRRRRAAALKSWCDEWTGDQFANLYLPDQILKYRISKQGTHSMSAPSIAIPSPEYPGFTGVGIEVAAGPYNVTERESAVANPMGVVPVLELRNRLRLRDGHCRSEIFEVVSTQDQIDKTLIDMLVASEFGAFRQRWATGIEIPEVDGKPIEAFDSAINRLWVTGSDAARFGDFNPTDLGQYVKVQENRIQSIAARTRTPPHYFLGQSGVFPSGESIKSAETGLVAKVRNRMVHFGEVWEEAMRLAFLVEGDTAKSEIWDAETIWADPESRTESEHVDATMKKKTLGVPTLQLWEDLGYTPAQVERFRTMLLDEAMLRMLAEPAAPVPVAAPVAVPAPSPMPADVPVA